MLNKDSFVGKEKAKEEIRIREKKRRRERRKI